MSQPQIAAEQPHDFSLEMVESKETAADEVLHAVPLTWAEMRDVLDISLRAGQILLENGANTARVEETVHRMATALGADWCDVYVTPTGMVATISAGGDHRTRIQRVVRSGVDLSRIAAVLAVSREAVSGNLTRIAVREQVEHIAVQPRTYGRYLTTLAVGLACACTAVLFGGGLWEFAITLLAAAGAFLLREPLLRMQFSRPLLTALTAFVASALAYGLAWVVGAAHPAQAVTASVLFLVPGVLMISSVVDLFRGDTVSGVARGTSALLVLIAIAGGLWAMLLVTRAQMNLELGRLDNVPLAMGLAFCSSVGFGVLFDVPQRALLVAALVGALAYGIDRWGLLVGMPSGAAAFIAGLAISALAEVLSRPFRLPTTVFTIPGFLPLVPGAAAFRTLLNFVADDYMNGTASLVRTAIIVVALAAGIGAGGALARVGRKPVF